MHARPMGESGVWRPLPRFRGSSGLCVKRPRGEAGKGEPPPGGAGLGAGIEVRMALPD
jgi:hypothetical protein